VTHPVDFLTHAAPLHIEVDHDFGPRQCAATNRVVIGQVATVGQINPGLPHVVIIPVEEQARRHTHHAIHPPATVDSHALALGEKM
jgi:hypothetical protein